MRVLDFVSSQPVVKAPFLSETCVHEQLQRPVDRRVPNIGGLFPDFLVELLGAHVFLAFEERNEDRVALPRVLEPHPVEIICQSREFGFKFHGRADYLRFLERSWGRLGELCENVFGEFGDIVVKVLGKHANLALHALAEFCVAFTSQQQHRFERFDDEWRLLRVEKD